MAKSLLSSDTLPKAGRVNEGQGDKEEEVCREWLVHEDGALAYRLQDEEIKEHYSGNKNRNAQVREDLPKAKIEQEIEALKYQSLVQQQEKKDEIVAKKIALSLEQDERKKKRDLQERMRLQLRLDDEAAQVEAQMEIQRYLQEEKDKELAKKLQEEEEQCAGALPESIINEQYLIDQKLAMEAQDAELARMLQEKERAKARRARERAKQKKLERQQMQQQQAEEQNSMERPQRPDKLDLKLPYDTNSKQRQKADYQDLEEIQVLEDSSEDIREVPNVAAMIDPTYNGNPPSTSSTSSSTTSPAYPLPTQELMEDTPCYMPIQGQRRNQLQTAQVQEEKQKRRVKDGCKQQ